MGKPFGCSAWLRGIAQGSLRQKEEGTGETTCACLMLCGGRSFADGLKAKLQLQTVLKDPMQGLYEGHTEKRHREKRRLGHQRCYCHTGEHQVPLVSRRIKEQVCPRARKEADVPPCLWENLLWKPLHL